VEGRVQGSVIGKRRGQRYRLVGARKTDAKKERGTEGEREEGKATGGGKTEKKALTGEGGGGWGPGEGGGTEESCEN